jgi:hypothetical protein
MFYALYDFNAQVEVKNTSLNHVKFGMNVEYYKKHIL